MDALKFSEDLGNGPIKKRWITDWLFSIFFVLFICGMGATAGYGYYLGDPAMLLLGWDSDQNGCGYNATTMDYPMLYWPQAPDAALIEDLKRGDYS